MTECYRTPDDKPGPDYVCAKCVELGVVTSDPRPIRLWREAHNAGDLLCVTHAMEKERKRLNTDDLDYVGYMLPARPTPEGDNFWGNAAGDVAWWYALPKWRDPDLEAEHVRTERLRFLQERDFYVKQSNEYMLKFMQAEHTLKVEQQSKVPANAKRWRDALVKIRDVQLADVGTNTPTYTTETDLKMRLVATEALR